MANRRRIVARTSNNVVLVDGWREVFVKNTMRGVSVRRRSLDGSERRRTQIREGSLVGRGR